MKLRYIKREKFNYGGSQYRQGDILEVEALGQLPENWFEVIEEAEVIEEKPKRTRKPKKKEVISYGDIESTDSDLDS